MNNSTVNTIIKKLKSNYSDPVWERRMSPIDELIFTILTQHTSDLNAEKAFNNLKRHYDNYENIISADDKKIAKLIKSGGLSNIKSKRIIGVLSEIQNRVGKLNIDFLKDMSITKARDWLTSINGIGPKTASCVLAFSFGLPVIPVDTHVHRVSKRIGLISNKISADEAHGILENKVKIEDRYKFHVLIIEHGRKVCHSRKPSCVKCSIQNLCEFQRQIN